MKKIPIFFALIILLPSIFALQGEMTLLAAHKNGNQSSGSPATLYLQVEEGEGRVFMETFPLAKIDTQMSARFAKEIACDFIDKDCNNYDFFYKIKSKSSIIGGPSAGSAITILTIALLNNLEMNKSVAITGTINSGNLIGPVGGIEAKLEAAKENNISLVLIPEQYDEEKYTNITIKADKLNISVKEVSYLNDALFDFTGFRIPDQNTQIIIDEDYSDIMKGLADSLCEKTESLSEVTPTINRTINLNESAFNLTIRSREAYEIGSYYTSASFCYGANVKYRNIELIEANYSKEVLDVEVRKLRSKIRDMEDELDEIELETITDLQTYVIVRERLIEASYQLDNFIETNYTLSHLANAYERQYSATTWSKFFALDGTELIIDNESLRDSCITKLAEAEERYSYVNYIAPGLFGNTEKALADTYELAKDEEYALCLFKASKVKASINVVLSTMGFSDNTTSKLIDLKLDAANRVIASQIEDGLFPIVGYSYYEYGSELKEADEDSALLYAEYALELSRLDLYFKEKEKTSLTSYFDQKLAIILVIGLVFGFASGFVVGKAGNSRKKH